MKITASFPAVLRKLSSWFANNALQCMHDKDPMLWTWGLAITQCFPKSASAG